MGCTQDSVEVPWDIGDPKWRSKVHTGLEDPGGSSDHSAGVALEVPEMDELVTERLRIQLWDSRCQDREVAPRKGRGNRGSVGTHGTQSRQLQGAPGAFQGELEDAGAVPAR